MDFLNQAQSLLGTIPGGMHDLPRNPDKLCSKFKFAVGRTVEQHIESFKDELIWNNI